jgi:hypothetical protein
VKPDITAASTTALLLVSGGFVGHEMIKHFMTITHDSATPGEVIGDRSLVACSANNAVLNFNDSRCFEINKRLFANLMFPRTSNNEWEVITREDNL